MARIFFFSIPAHGHVNPTLPFVRELIIRGHSVRYYNAEAFREKIEASGAEFHPIDAYMPPEPDDLKKRAGKDFASLIEMAADVTLSLEADFAHEIEINRPNLIIADSICLWGKLLAEKYHLPFLCSTTTLAFNQHTAKRMKQHPFEILRMVLGMGRIGKKLAQLRSHGFHASNLPSLIGNDSNTLTIVYTSRRFQPEADTFGDHYAFVGPLVMQEYPRAKRQKPLIYISLGTVLHDAPNFYRQCLRAIAGMDCEAILSVGESVIPEQLGEIPPNAQIFPRVNQLEVLAQANVFLTHCGMNSVSESLLCGVPMVFFPQHSEENAVAGRAEELGVGIRLRRPAAACIRQALETVLKDSAYAAAAQAICSDFHACGGAAAAADFAESLLE